MFLLQQKKTSNQEMQIFIKLNTETSRNTNENNYNNKIMQKKMMSKHEISTASFKTKLSQESAMIQQENRMRIINANLR